MTVEAFWLGGENRSVCDEMGWELVADARE